MTPSLQHLKINILLRTSSDVKVEGYQISATLGGSRVIGSVEPKIDNMEVTGWGLVYGLAKANGNDMGITEADMHVGSDNPYVVSYQSTSEGTMNIQVGSSETATYFVRTMIFSSYSAASFNAEYKVRAYAILSDGSYVYGNVVGYSIYNVADRIYQNRLMNTIEGHRFLYDKILKVVSPDYKEVDYNWGSSIEKPGTMEQQKGDNGYEEKKILFADSIILFDDYISFCRTHSSGYGKSC